MRVPSRTAPGNPAARPAEGNDVSHPQPAPEQHDSAAQPAELPGPLRTGSTRAKGHPAVRYTLLRIVLFAAVMGVVWLLSRYVLKLGGNGAGIFVVGVSLAVSGLLSYFLLDKQRDAMSAALVDRVERAKARIEEGASAEDDGVVDVTPRPRAGNAT